MVKLYFLGTDKRSIYLREMYEQETKNENSILVTTNLEEADIIKGKLRFSLEGSNAFAED